MWYSVFTVASMAIKVVPAYGGRILFRAFIWMCNLLILCLFGVQNYHIINIRDSEKTCVNPDPSNATLKVAIVLLHQFLTAYTQHGCLHRTNVMFVYVFECSSLCYSYCIWLFKPNKSCRTPLVYWYYPEHSRNMHAQIVGVTFCTFGVDPA